MTTTIRRIDQLSGRIDLLRTVDGDCKLASDCNNHLLLAATNELQKFDTEGRCIHRVSISLECNFRKHRSLLLPDIGCFWGNWANLIVDQPYPTFRQCIQRVYKMTYFVLCCCQLIVVTETVIVEQIVSLLNCLNAKLAKASNSLTTTAMTKNSL